MNKQTDYIGSSVDAIAVREVPKASVGCDPTPVHPENLAARYITGIPPRRQPQYFRRDPAKPLRPAFYGGRSVPI